MDVLYRWPPAAAYGKTVPKEQIYQHAKVTAAVKDAFVAQVAHITWAYTLAERTVNLAGAAAVPEIQVFVIDAKGSDVAHQVLATIDRAVTSPIIFEIAVSDGLFACTRMAAAAGPAAAAAGESPGGRRASTPVRKRTAGPYYSTPWIRTDLDRVPVPTALSLPALYAAILQQIAGVAQQPGAAVSEVSARLGEIRALQREVAALTKRMHAERQFNRKVELHRMLSQRNAELGRLQRSG